MSPTQILLFEDDPGQALMTREALEAGGYLVDISPDGTKGLELFSKNTYDVVLLDLEMPDMTGLEVFQELKRRSPWIVVIMVTGSGDESAAVEAFRLGIADYIVKASNAAHLATLPTVIEHALGHEALKREKERLQAELRDYAATLEKRVAERTLELETTLKETHRLESNLVQAEKLSGIGQLAAGVAHELNSPLAGILELTRGFLRRSDPDSKDHKLFDAMRRAAEHAATIIRDLSAFARAPRSILAPVDINDLIEKTLSFAGHDLETQKVILKKRYAGNLPQVLGDESQIQQVFLNMMANARDAMAEKKEGHKELLIETSTGDQTVEVRFTDTGEGIPEEILGKIFDPFFSTKGIGKGTGLGLSISHGIIERHKGKIEVKSVMGERTTFTISLPAAENLLPHPPSSA